MLGWVLLLIILLGIVWATLWLAIRIKRLWTEDVGPLFDNQEQTRRIRRRRLFARYLRDEIFRLNSQEEWGDHRFAELEATVEAEGLRSGGLLDFLPWLRTTGVRREKSLSRAIALSAERLILLEGDPGAGKSVALRHVALQMAEDAAKSRRKRQVLPVYLNLKELKVSSKSIDRADIERFVLTSMNRINDRDVVDFLDDEFPVGIENGTWFFLFDSFDEIPQILSSVEPDATIQLYSNAVADFLSGLNRCRGVIASRHFRGPQQFGWPKFTVLNLSEYRRNKLIRKADLTRLAESTLLSGLSSATAEIAEMSRNPMFLGLLCDYVRSNGSFPSSVHIAFETYTEHRLTRDMHRLQQRFGLNPDKVRKCAQDVAFCMSAEPGLGLSADRDAIRLAMGNHGFLVSEESDSALDALEFIKLARPGIALPGEARRFTFAHRRFQEYFSTSVVLREPTRVTAQSLLSDGRWRETAVVMFQLQPTMELAPLLAEAARQLEAMVMVSARTLAGEFAQTPVPSVKFYAWRPLCLHLLGILQEGFSRRPGDLPAKLRELVAILILPPSLGGDLGSRKYAIDVAGCASDEAFVRILRLAFQSDSEWLRSAAYRQLSHLKEVPDDIASAIRLSIVRRAFFARSRSSRLSMPAHLSRLSDSVRFSVISNVTRSLFKVDLLAHGVAYLMLLPYLRPHVSGKAGVFFVVLLSYLLLRYHSAGKSVSALSKLAGAVFEWQWIIFWRFSIGVLPIMMVYEGTKADSDFRNLGPELMRQVQHGSGTAWIVSVGVLYLLLWAPATVWMAINRGLSPPWTVLITPVTLPAIVIWRLRRSFTWEKFVALLFAFPILGMLGYLTILVITWLPASILRIARNVFFTLTIAALLYAVGRQILPVWRDLRRWQQWRVRRPTKTPSITGSEFVDTWLSFETQLFRTRFVRLVRDSSLLTIGDETAVALENAVSKLRIAPDATATHKVGFRRDWLLLSDPLLVGRRRSEEAAAELLDELFIMLERIQQAGHSAGAKATNGAEGHDN